MNRGPEFRYHLVWDMPLTARVFRLMFQATPPPAGFLERTCARDCVVDPVGRVRITDYETYGPPRDLYDRLRVGRLGVPRRLFQRAFNNYDYLRHRLRDSVSLCPDAPPAAS